MSKTPNCPYVEFETSSGVTFFVSPEDADVVTVNGPFCANTAGGRNYIQCTINGTQTYLHRLIAGAPRGMVVDHIDGNSRNCTRSNLRICTQQQNMRNNHKSRTGVKRPYIGVSAISKYGKSWAAQIRQNGSYEYIGSFDCAEDAARARDKRCLELRGEFAVLNFPKEGESNE